MPYDYAAFNRENRNLAGTVHELDFTIAGASSYSSPYRPERILKWNPYDSSSRWSTEIKGVGEAWILLKLKHPSVLADITFRKHYKPHPCNLRDFEVWIGPNEDRLQLAVRGALGDDDTAESFSLLVSPFRDERGDIIQEPSQFIKIIPLSAHFPKYNASIWNVVIGGIDDAAYLTKTCISLQNAKERDGMRLVMKFLRQRGLDSTCRLIQTTTGLHLEDVAVTQLYGEVVDRMDYMAAEATLEEIGKKDGFSSYLSRGSPFASWRKVEPVLDGEAMKAPSIRSGYAMCLVGSECTSQIYLFGGCDGSRELADLWSYDIAAGRWHLLSGDGEAQGGPAARSGHAMAFDPRTKSIFILGGSVHSKVAVNTRSSRRFPTEDSDSDFYRLRLNGQAMDTWERLSKNTAADGGPGCLEGHRMIADSDSQRLYVFGSEKILDQRSTKVYSSMYCYDIAARAWHMVFDDKVRGGPMLCRRDHSMLFDSASKTIYMLGGTRDGMPLRDMWAVRLPSGNAVPLIDLPDAACTGRWQRSIWDRESKEIRLFVDSGGSTPLCFSWRSTLASGTWRKLETDHYEVPAPWAAEDDQIFAPEVLPERSTFEVVYDNDTKQHFLFGSVAGQPEPSLWSMTLQRPSADEAVRRAGFLLRRQRFKELCRETSDVQTVLNFLRDNVAPVVNMGSVEETAEYHALVEDILRLPDIGDRDTGVGAISRLRARPVYTITEGVDEDIFKARMKVFEDLLEFIDPAMKQPDDDLLDKL